MQFFVYTHLNVKTVLFETIQLSISTQFSSIRLIDRTLTGTPTPGQSGPGSNGSKKVLRIPQSSSIAGTSPSDCLVSYLGHSLWGFLPLCRQAIGVFCSSTRLAPAYNEYYILLFHDWYLSRFQFVLAAGFILRSFFSLKEIESTVGVQILYEVAFISLSSNFSEKCMNPSFLIPARGKLGGRLDSLALVRLAISEFSSLFGTENSSKYTLIHKLIPPIFFKTIDMRISILQHISLTLWHKNFLFSSKL